MTYSVTAQSKYDGRNHVSFCFEKFLLLGSIFFIFLVSIQICVCVNQHRADLYACSSYKISKIFVRKDMWKKRELDISKIEKEVHIKKIRKEKSYFMHTAIIKHFRFK